VAVNDPGHTHVGIVNDPGHGHGEGLYAYACGTGKGGSDQAAQTVNGDRKPELHTNTSKTGITVDNLPAKSAVSVSIDANDAGEHLPLVYVLICQNLKVA
jgi:hypothetical protein